MRRLTARAREERGFTMVTVMAVMFCVTMLSIAALSAAQGDLQPGAHDKSRKVAYAAADAGVQNYLFHLSQDPNYWAKCTTGAAPNAVNDPWNGVSPAADPRRFMNIPGSQSRYAIELLPANGNATCSTSSPDSSMIDTASGTFKIRSTGQDVATGVKRSIVVTFKRKSFLDYLYFTDKEALSPGLYGMYRDSRVTRENVGAGRDVVTWARQQCDRYSGDDPALGNRAGQLFDGEYQDQTTGTWSNFDLTCKGALFQSGDVVAGPVHTNDELEIDCGTPAAKFGDSIDDVIETSALGRIATNPPDPDSGWSGCTAPDVNFSTTSPARAAGTWRAHAAALTLPPTNSALKHDTAAAYRFKGTTKIVLNGTTMRVTGTREDGTVLSASDVAIPPDGVVYVATNGSCPDYTAVDSGAAPATCGNLELQGNYAANVTFTAENDILLKDDVTRTTPGSPFLLGLIATNYVRVEHRVTGCSPSSPLTCNYITGCTNAAGTPTDVNVEAAILSLTRSFMVDNWFCGANLGTLRVYGAIAQMFRGPVVRVNTGALAGTSGFGTKDYVYDDRLKYRSPPFFLDPVQSQWRIQTYSEQAPAR
jgi:type II secretory pathway pseudopilin PulG